MSFSVSVYRLADREFVSTPPVDAWSPEFAIWEEEVKRRLVFDAALGSDVAVHRYWSGPAARAGLPLIAGIYESGLDAQGSDLDRLGDELLALQDLWSSEIDPSATERFACPGYEGEVPILYDLLFRRAEFLRGAIQIAQAIDGYLSVC